jgi:NAD-dependent deacetylase
MNLGEKIRQAADMLRRAHYASVLTGAGISTPSGIPDFRSPESGMWTKYNPFEVASIYAFRQNPENFYDWVRPMAELVFSTQPNPAHLALAQLEQMGIIQAIVTQNIDGLHHKAGSKTVHEVHGHLREATCVRCYAVQPAEPLIRQFLRDKQVPRCQCGGVIKPNAILFGEQLPIKTLIAAQVAARDSDVMLVAGSSLTVAPAGNLPLLTKETGGQLIIVNLSTTHLDELADVVIHADVVDILPNLVQHLSQQPNAGAQL